MQQKKKEHDQLQQHSSFPSSASSTALPLSMAFVQLFFSIFPGLTSFGVGTGLGGERKYSDRKERQPHQQQQQPHQRNAEKVPTARGNQKDIDELHQGNHPYRGCYLRSSSEGQNGYPLSGVPPASSSLYLPAHELTALPSAVTAEHLQSECNAPDYRNQHQHHELQFYGQLKQMLDLPILFAICFVQLISFVLVLNIEECSPLVLFSWWRNKIS